MSRLNNLITDVEGIKVGNAEDKTIRTGTTVILPDEPVVAAADVRGGGPGTREIDALDPSCMVEHIHAICLSGGSAYGLDAAGGVMEWLAKRKRGFQIADAIVPIVPTAILFDLINGGDKSWQSSPYPTLGQAACEAANDHFPLGNVGAGYGALAGNLKGGLGSASSLCENGATIGALVAVNCFGNTTMGDQAAFFAHYLEQDNEFGGAPSWSGNSPVENHVSFSLPTQTNTTIGVIATDMTLTRAQAQRVAIMAHDGYARAIHPVHTPFDGDTIFVLSTAKKPLTDPIIDITKIGMMAADTMARAIARGVYSADSLDTGISYREKFGV